MIFALLGSTLSAPGADLGSALSSAFGCLLSLFVLAAIPLAAYAALQIRQRLRHAKNRIDPLNFRQAGKTPVNGGAVNGGGNP